MIFGHIMNYFTDMRMEFLNGYWSFLFVDLRFVNLTKEAFMLLIQSIKES